MLGDRERRGDLLIEHLHLIQDKYGCLSAAHLSALAHEMRLKVEGQASPSLGPGHAGVPGTPHGSLRSPGPRSHPAPDVPPP